MKKTVSLIILITVLTALIALYKSDVWGEDGAKAFIDPKDSIFTTAQKAIGDKILFNYALANVTELFGYEFRVEWNSTLFRGINVTENLLSTVTPPGEEDNIWQVWRNVADDHIHCAYTFYNHTRAMEGGYGLINITANEYAEGKLAAATLELEILARPQPDKVLECTINITISKLEEHDATSIPHSIEDGNYRLIWVLPSPPLILNGGFETGTFENWEIWGLVGLPQGTQIVSSRSHSGQYCAWSPMITWQGERHIRQNLTEDVPLSRDLVLEAWIIPEKTGPLMTHYPQSCIILRFENISERSSTYVLRYQWSGYVLSNSSESGTIILFHWVTTDWNHLMRNLRNDLMKLGVNADDMVLISIEFRCNYSTGNPGGFFVDDVSLMYKSPSKLSIATHVPSIYAGFHVNITGVLSSHNGSGIANENVTLYFRIPNIENWIPITMASTSENGRYFIVWIPFATGDFLLKAEWVGNPVHLGTSNTTMLSVLAYEGRHVFSVTSNSTLSSLAFNSTSKELTFVVSGPSGTSGYVDVVISKSLVTSAEEIKVYLNGAELNYTVESMNDSWQLHFIYLHSEHEVRITLATGLSHFLESPLGKTILIGIFITITVFILALFVVRSRQKESSMRKNSQSLGGGGGRVGGVTFFVRGLESLDLFRARL